MKKDLIKILSVIGLAFLLYFLLVTYTYFTENIYILSYHKEIILLLLGPITFIINDPKLLIFNPFSGDINYFGLIPSIIMLISLALGILRFKKHLFYKILLFIGSAIWFGFGFVTIGIFYLEAV